MGLPKPVILKKKHFPKLRKTGHKILGRIIQAENSLYPKFITRLTIVYYLTTIVLFTYIVNDYNKTFLVYNFH